jgi:hypothetical protein
MRSCPGSAPRRSDNLAATTGLSEHYCSLIRLRKRCPMPGAGARLPWLGLRKRLSPPDSDWTLRTTCMLQINPYCIGEPNV